MQYTNIIKQQGLVITYQQDKPQLFIDCVNRYVDYSNNHLEHQLENNTNIIFQDEHKNVLAKCFEDSKALCINIAQQPEFKQAFIKLTQAIIKTSEHHDYELGYIDDKHYHGEDLMFGLIAMDSGEHSLLIEDWMLGMNWRNEVNQSDIIIQALNNWGVTTETCRLVILRMSLCSGQHGQDYFEHKCSMITEDKSVWALFCQSGEKLSAKIGQINNTRNEHHQLTPITLGLKWVYSNENKNELRIKLTSHLLNDKTSCEAYFENYFHNNELPPYEIKKELDRWFYHAEHKGFIKQAIRQLFHTHWDILNEVNSHISWETQLKTIHILRNQLAGLPTYYANYFIKYLESNIKKFSKQPYTQSANYYKDRSPDLANHPHVFNPHTNDEGINTFIIAYDPEYPNLFHLSVEQLASYLDANPDAKLGNGATLYFCDFKGKLIATEFEQTTALCIEIAKQKALQASYIFLCKMIIDRSINFPRHGYIDEDANHGQDLVYGLTVIGSGAHSTIIEDWMLSVDWDHDYEQSLAIDGAFEWNETIEEYRIEILSYTTCRTQAFENSMSDCTTKTPYINHYCHAALQIKYKLHDYNYRYLPFGHASYQLNESLLNYLSVKDSWTQEAPFKVIVHITESTSELITYFEEYIHKAPNRETFLKHLDEWSAQLDGTKDNLLKLIKSMKNTFKRFHKEFSKASDRDALEAKFRALKNNCPEEHPERALMLKFILQEF